VDALQFVASLVSSLAWPLALVAIVLILRRPLTGLLGRIVKARGYGIEAEFAEAQASVALATAAVAGIASGSARAFDATVRVRESLVSTLADTAKEAPAAAVTIAYAEIEKAIRARIGEAAEGAKLSSSVLVAMALGRGVISSETAEAVRGLTVLRNLAAHGDEVDPAKALDYLMLADAVIYAIETWQPH